MRHVCHAEGCTVPVDPKMLMCLRHWRMVSPQLRSAIWTNYRPGQEVDKRPSEDYMRVYRAAVNAVAEKEGRKIPFPVRRSDFALSEEA